MPALLSGFLQRQRLRAVGPYLRGAVLDLGCGNSPVIAQLQPRQTYAGVDNRADLLRQLRQRHPALEFHQRDLDRDPLALLSRFDTIIMLAVVEHLRYPERLLCQLPDYLLPGGRLLITTPAPFGDSLHKVGARIGLFSMAAMHDHHEIFTRASLDDRLRRSGLDLVRYHRFLLGGNQLFVCQASHAPSEKLA